MSNMSYCRFENTYNDLKDCWDNWDDINISVEEAKYKNKIFNLAKKIINESDNYTVVDTSSIWNNLNS
jgi:hypothetical protein